MHYCYCEAEVRSSSVSVVYVVRLRIVFSKAALQKRGSIEPMEPPLDPPLLYKMFMILLKIMSLTHVLLRRKVMLYKE